MLRAAVAEVEEYVRVDVVSESPDLVAGIAVNDLIHLFAELVENATVFSPPNTRIEVRADRVGAGLVAEIEDRGLGLSEEELADINSRLASPAEFDLANSEQLGLFVVSRLAARHSIKVSLRRSAYGGTTAILLLPFGVIVRAGRGLLHRLARRPAGRRRQRRRDRRDRASPLDATRRCPRCPDRAHGPPAARGREGAARGQRRGPTRGAPGNGRRPPPVSAAATRATAAVRGRRRRPRSPRRPRPRRRAGEPTL